jgi:hypothetical protein
MLSDYGINCTSVCAVCEGRLVTVRELINSYGLSYSARWSEGYNLVRDAVEGNHTKVDKLL